MAGFAPVGSIPVGSLPPTYPVARDAIDSADWTGIEQRLNADPKAVRRVEAIVHELNVALDSAGLTNAERARAGALTQAIVALVQSPDPEWKVIARLLLTLLDSQAVKASLNAAQITTIIGGALKLLGVF